MRVLMISRDPNIFREGSASALRHGEYKKLVDDLRVIGIGKGFFRSELRGNRGFDLVTTQDPFEAGILGWIMAWWYNASLQIQVHTDFLNPLFAAESFKNTIRVWIAGLVLRRASCVRVVSSRIARSLIQAGIAVEDSVSVLPILSEAKSASVGAVLKARYPQFSHILLMASRLTREKNIPLAISAFKKVLSHYPAAGLVIVGEGPLLSELKELVEAQGLSKSVVFEKWNDSPGSYYASADLFLLTSNYEGYGLTLQEAAKAGCPIVTTDVGLVGDLLGSSEAGIVPPGDEAALAAEIREALSNDGLRKSRREKAREALGRLPSQEHYLDMYKQLWSTCGKR